MGGASYNAHWNIVENGTAQFGKVPTDSSTDTNDLMNETEENSEDLVLECIVHRPSIGSEKDKTQESQFVVNRLRLAAVSEMAEVLSAASLAATTRKTLADVPIIQVEEATDVVKILVAAVNNESQTLQAFRRLCDIDLVIRVWGAAHKFRMSLLIVLCQSLIIASKAQIKRVEAMQVYVMCSQFGDEVVGEEMLDLAAQVPLSEIPETALLRLKPMFLAKLFSRQREILLRNFEKIRAHLVKGPSSQWATAEYCQSMWDDKGRARAALDSIMTEHYGWTKET